MKQRLNGHRFFILYSIALLCLLEQSIAVAESDTSKEIIIRDDDVHHATTSLKWLSDLAIRKDIKITFGVIPGLMDHEFVEYMASLNQSHFEIATHGFMHNETEKFHELPYLVQYKLINLSTETLYQAFHKRPHTFIAPWDNQGSNTKKALVSLGYHSISVGGGIDKFFAGIYKLYSNQGLEVFPSDIWWETNWNPEITHLDLKQFKQQFDVLYNSSDKYIVINMHDETFMNGDQLNRALTDSFEESIDYMKGRDVNFVTFDDAHQLAILIPGQG